MKQEILKKSTQKLYNLVKQYKLKGNIHPSVLDIEIPKSDFEEKEWEFLVENENKFKTHIDVKVEDEYLPIFQIKEDILYTNEISVINIQNKHYEKL